MVKIFALFLISLVSLQTFAKTSLTAIVDRTQIYETETLTLKVTGNVDMEFSFGGLMNFGRGQVDAPETADLEKQFDILDQQQSYNMRSINGTSTSQVTWTYSLAPKTTGKLIIPSLTFKDAQSAEININVLTGKDSSKAPDAFIEIEVDKKQAYVQEQIIYTLRLFTSGRLASGNLSEPVTSNAIIEQLGEDNKFYRMAHHRRYEVIERKYLVFPQKSGQLIIEEQNFNGVLIDSNNRRRIRARDKSESVTINVIPPPPEFTGDIWLPASSFRLTENWQGDMSSLFVGDSITRSIDMTALGLLGSALPPIEMKAQQGLKVYPDQAVVESVQHELGAQASRKQANALVAISATKINLPEISIPWWDTINNIERVETIPAQSFEIRVNPDLIQEQQATRNLETAQISSSQDDNVIDLSEEEETTALVNSNNNQAWVCLIVLLVLGWVTSVWFLLQRLQLHEKQNLNFTQTTKVNQHLTLFKTLQTAIKSNDKEMTKHLIIWLQSLNSQSPEHPTITCLADIENIDAELFFQASAYEKQLYSNSPEQSGYDAKKILDYVKRLEKPQKQGSNAETLKPFYP